MCFSAVASFTASAVLCAAGVITVKKAPHPSQKYFASIPFIFSIQQLSEGFVWLSLTNASYAHWQIPSTYFFLFFAQVFWPVWVPLSLLLMEKDKKAKMILSSFLLVGILISAYLSFSMVRYEITSEIRGYHMYYLIHYPFHTKYYSGLIYLVPTVLSTLVSKTRNIWIFGLLCLLAYIVSRTYFNDYVLSVWCFFAALISVLIYIILHGLKKPLELILEKTKSVSV